MIGYTLEFATCQRFFILLIFLLIRPPLTFYPSYNLSECLTGKISNLIDTTQRVSNVVK